MTEKRNFFRVNQDVFFDHQNVDAYTANNEDAQTLFGEELPVQLFAAFRQIDKQCQEIARHFSDNERPILEYVYALNRKIDLLARELVGQKLPDGQKKKARINISEGGLAFLSEKALYKDAFLALRLVFLPSYVGVTLFAQVIRCETTKNGGYHIAVKFHRITEAQQQILAKTILEAQLAEKRQAKPKDESKDQLSSGAGAGDGRRETRDD